MVFIIIKRFAAFIILLAFLGCNEKVFTFDVSCDECYTIKPDSVDLIIDITLNNLYDTVPIIIYEGKEGGNVIYQANVVETPWYVFVKADKEYALKAIYKTNDRIVNTINGTKPQVKRVTDACEEICWVVTNENVNLKLAY